ncbi:MAG: cyclase family protein [Acidobacteriota bacterium]|nr:cyclase family protein [Acidobacteriota bacterium]
MSDLARLLQLLSSARVYDLAQCWFTGMPHYPTHPPFLYSLTKKHGDLVLDSGASSAADSIALGTHVGTHVDALCHFSCDGKMYGGVEVDGIQDYGRGIDRLSIDTVAPMLRRGVLLDIAGYLGIEFLPPDFTIDPAHLDAVCAHREIAIQNGDVVLLRTGWANFWNDPARYITGGRGSQPAGPGPQLEGARWLSSKGVFAVGSDTVAFERVPSAMEVHVHLLVESGIHIIEALNLEELAQDGITEFAFLAAPLKIRGATGSPVRPIGLVPRAN